MTVPSEHPDYWWKWDADTKLYHALSRIHSGGGERSLCKDVKLINDGQTHTPVLGELCSPCRTGLETLVRGADE